MSTSRSIRFKAFLLTIVFLSNTVMGFACTVGVDMGFNKGHHGEHSVIKETTHSHPPGTKKHSHKSEHAKAPISQHNETDSTDKKDNCCKDEVAKFVSIDKQILKSNLVKVLLSSHDLVIPVYGQLTVLAISVHTPDNSYFVRCHHPPIPDIRIAVQSFQI